MGYIYLDGLTLTMDAMAVGPVYCSSLNARWSTLWHVYKAKFHQQEEAKIIFEGPKQDANTNSKLSRSG